MADLNKFTSEEIQARIDKISPAVLDVLGSDKMDEKLYEIGTKYNLLEDLNESDSLKQLILFLCAGILSQNELVEQIETYTYRNSEEAAAIAKDILEILGPVLPIPPVGPTEVKPNAPINARPSEIQREETKGFGQFKIKPVEIKEAETKPAEPKTMSVGDPAPFILHENKELPAIKYTLTGSARPTFIKPNFGATYNTPPLRPTPAKVDFGGNEELPDTINLKDLPK